MRSDLLVNNYKEREDNFLFIEDLEIHYVELNKFNFKDDIDNLNDLEEWVVFLRECSPSGNIDIIEKLSKKKEEIGEAMAIMNKLSADEAEYQQYLAREKYLMDEMSKKKYAEHKMKLIEEKLKVAEDQVKEAEQQAKAIEQQVKEVLICQLKRKFNNISDEYISRIFNAPIEITNKISEYIFDLESVEELNRYL
ncbi:MAG: PD-(D/E)XK nuclease family transposase [Clostridium sp.]|uniref:PD-(D/E)XK nuclease family transposase n=1 Tax=Clostridium sp. TaxID=1506 RepID=UPI003051F57B